MIAAAFLVLLRPYSIQCALLLLLLLLGTIATILFFCCWHRRLRNGKHPMKSVLSGRSRSRIGLRTHHFRSEGFRHSPRHARRSIHARVTEDKHKLVELPESEPDTPSNLRKRKVKKRVLPEFYQSVQVTPTRKPQSSSSGNPSLHCSMSSSADFSDDDDYSIKSGSASPAPGDTLPWNLPRHERSKRKIQGGSVLDPAERAVLRIADERDRVQKKTFTKWINQHLVKVRKHINDLYEDLRDGHNLISLLEVLSGDKLPRERDFLKTLRLVSGTDACAVEQHGDTVDDDDKGPRERGRMRFHRLQNVQIALDYLKRRQVKLVNIRNDDITDGNPKLTLGLIWTIILHFQISEIHVTGESEDMTAKERLLLWSKQMTDGYVGVRCDNFTTSWRDGRLFNAIIHKYRPDLIDMSRVSTQTNRSNLENAFCVAEQLGVARLLDPEDVDVQCPDEKSVITYVSTLYDSFPKVPDGVDGISPNDVDIKWVEYQNMIKYLSQWIKHNVAMMSDRSFPNNPVELKALYTQYLQFKENEIPLKENEKTKIQNLYKMLEVWIEFGRIHLPPGHHPNDVEKEWGKLIVAMLEREKCLRPEVERLEMLQQIANRVQRDCVNGDDKLALARIALQSDAKRLESGIQFLHEAEIAGYLLECENILRQQVMDIQLLLDGKFPFADQLVQRVSKLRDDLLSLRAECSSVYSKGRTLTTEQTKMMISGITQSLNSGFSQNFGTNLTPVLTPAITPGGLSTPGSTFTSSLTPSLTPGLQPSSVQSYMGSGGVMDPGSLRQLKHMQIRKPLQKSSLADSNMTEEEVNMKYVQDLLVWVEEMQVQLDRSEWGSDLPSVETHLETHKSVQRAIEEFQISLKDARLSEIQMTIPLKLTYSDKLNQLEKQYERLLSCSRERQSNLESLYDFVSHATQELIWLNEKEEEEVAFDWSDRNSSVSKKRDYHAELMMELEEKEEVIKSVQDKAERLMFKNHPAKITIEAYRAAMQTQWSWILQLCSCVEQHLKENAVYFEFFSDAKESMDYLRNLQESIQRKYSCDRSSSLHRLEDLIQESMDEKEQLLQYRSTVAGLVGRAKNIVQLRPRNPESLVRSSLPVKAICDYRQIEITIYKDDECILANNSHRAKWKVINPAGNEAMVPSVCFTVPPPNKEAVEKATRTEQLYQNVLALWHHSHINMKSVVSWHYLMADIRAIRNWNVASIKTMLPGEHQQVLSNLQSHFDEFLDDSKESEVFTLADRTQLERDVAACKEYYQELLRSAEREEHEELVYNNYISEIRNFRMHLEAHEEHLIRQIRTPLERDDLEQSLQRITEHGRKTAELNKLKEDLDVMKEKCELFLRQAAVSPSVPTLSSELTVLIQSMSQVYSMSSIYMDKLKTVSLVVKHSQSAEALVKFYESKLYVEDAMNSDVKSIETVISTLKQWRTEIDEKQEVFHDMEDELKRARLISDRMFKAHNERDFDLDWHKEKADQLSERWQNIHSQIDSRLRDLDGINKSLKNYRDTYSCLDEWVREMEAAQLKAQENKPEDSKALAELLNKQKVLVAEIEQKQSRIDECQKYSEQYSSAIKDYELQLMTFSAMVDSQHKSPLKKRRMQSSSDAIQQEFMDLRTRYTALVTLMTQYVKFASETLKRTEDEERSVDEEKREHGDKVSKLLHWTKQTLNTDGNAVKDSNANTDASNKPQVSVEEMVTKKEQIAEALRTTQMMLNKHSDRMTEEEREKAQEQLKSLNQAFSELSQQCLDQTTSAEEVFNPSDETGWLWTGTNSSLTDDITEAQLMICDDSIHDHIYKFTLDDFSEMSDANRCIQTSYFSSVSLSDVAAARKGPNCEDLVVKVIEIKQICDEMEVCYTGDTLTLDRAFHSGLIPASVYIEILHRQQTCQDMMDPKCAGNVPPLEPEEEFGPCKINRLILKCLSRNESPATGRNINTLRSIFPSLSDQEVMSRLLDAQLGVGDPKEGQNVTAEKSEDARNLQNGDKLKVDAAVQCDLLSSSSTLVVLGNQQQFMGLVLPHSGGIQTFSTSFHYHEQNTTDYTSSVFGNWQKIVAFYIPETSEILDITSAIENGLTDSYTADVLKAIEIPDVFPDLDQLHEHFSSWLMYKNLRVTGSYQDAESIKVDNIPSPTEARQLFISYLMMNSFIDLQSGQRVVILDKQLSKMINIFLEDVIFSNTIENNVSSLSINMGNPSEQLMIDEETEVGENTPTFDPHDFVSSGNGRITFDAQSQRTFDIHDLVSSGNSKVTLDENTYVFVSPDNERIIVNEQSQHTFDPHDFASSGNGRISFNEQSQYTFDPHDLVSSGIGRITFNEQSQHTFDPHDLVSSGNGRITFNEQCQHTFDPHDLISSGNGRITFNEQCQHTFDPHDLVSSGNGRITFNEQSQHTFDPHDLVSSGNGRITFDAQSQHTFDPHDLVSSGNGRITFSEQSQHTFDPHHLVSSGNGRITFNEQSQHTFDSHDLVSSGNGRITFNEQSKHTFDPHDLVSSGNGRITFNEQCQHTFDPHDLVSSGNGRITFNEQSQPTFDPHDLVSSGNERITFNEQSQPTFDPHDLVSSGNGRITFNEQCQHTFDPHDLVSSGNGRITFNEQSQPTFDPHDLVSSGNERITFNEQSQPTFDPHDLVSSGNERITFNEQCQHTFDPHDLVSSGNGRITFSEQSQHTFDPHDLVSSGNGRITFNEQSQNRFDPSDFVSSGTGRISFDEQSQHTFDPHDFVSSNNEKINFDENMQQTFNHNVFVSSDNGGITVNEQSQHTFDPRDLVSSGDGRITFNEQSQHTFDPHDLVSSGDGRITFNEQSQYTFDPHDLVSSGNGRITFDENTQQIFDPNVFVSSDNGRIPLSEQSQHTFDPHDFVSSDNERILFGEQPQHISDPPNYVSSDNWRITINEKINSDSTDTGIEEKSMSQNTTCQTKPDEFAERVCESSSQTDVGDTLNECLDIPASVEMTILSTLTSVKNTYVGSLTTMCHSESAVTPISQTQEPYDAESVCSESKTVNLVEGEHEGDYVPDAQVENRVGLDVTSGGHHDMGGALSKGLQDRTIQKQLDLQADERGNVEVGEEESVSFLKQILSDGPGISNITFPSIEEQHLLKSDCTVSTCESLQSRLFTDAVKILNVDVKADLFPEEKGNQSISVDQNVDLISINETENTQGSTESKVTDIVLEEDVEENVSTLDCVTRGNGDERSHYLQTLPPSVSPVSSPSTWNQETMTCISPTDKSPLLAEDTDSLVLINSDLADRATASVEIESATLATQSRPSTLIDKTSNNNNPDPESHSYHSNKPDSPSIHIDSCFTGYNSPLGKETLRESELDESSPNHNGLSEESRWNNDTNAVQSPVNNEQNRSMYYSSSGDLVESAITSVSRGDHSNDKNIADDGSRITLPQYTVLHSESDFSVGSEPTFSENGVRSQQQNSSQLAVVVSSEITASNLSNHEVSCDTLLTAKHPLDSKHSGSDEAELHFESFSLERQHEDLISCSEQISVSRSETENEEIEATVCCLHLPSASSDIISGPSETSIREMSGSVILPEGNGLEVKTSENPQKVTDDLTLSASSMFSNAESTCGDHLEGMLKTDTNVGETKVTDSNIISNPDSQEPILDDGEIYEGDTAHELVERSEPGLLMDLPKQNTSSLNNSEHKNPVLIQHKVCEKTEEPDDPNIQLQTLQHLKTVSLSQELSVRQEVMDTLSGALGGESQEDQQEHKEAEDEGSAEENLDLSHKPSQLSTDSDACKVVEIRNKLVSIQDFLECVGKLQDHADILDDVRKDLLIHTPTGKNMEELQLQIEECQSLESQLSKLAGGLAVDVEKAKWLLNSAHDDIPIQIHQDLASMYLQLEPNFTTVSQQCAEKNHSLIQAMETQKGHLESMYQKHLSDLEELAGLIQNESEIQGMDLNSCDVDMLKHCIQQNKDTESNFLNEARYNLEDVTFDIQSFISEHAQFLSATQSSSLLKFLSTTQRALRDQTEKLVTRRTTLEVLLDKREQENHVKSLLEKHKEFTEKLEEMCDNLTLTENRLIGHQQQTESAESVTDLQQYQHEHQALQKDVLTDASALNEVIASTKNFLEENRNKLMPDQIAVIESKLEEAKSKAKLINQRAEESRKDLEKVVTTAIKQESEKAAAVERLEESKNKIEGLLDWISNIGSEKESSLNQSDPLSNENGNLPEQTSTKGLIGENDDANGNALETTENDSGRETQGNKNASMDLNKQYDRVKAHHQEILSQQQDLIMATQSAQALLERQANVLSPEEKDKLQKNIQELKGRYEASLTQAEQQMKHVQCVQEELKKFQDDCEEFEGWLNQSEGEIQGLGAPAASLNILSDKLQRQKSFSEDVISHKGDLRFITISGQKVLDVAKACGMGDPAAKNPLLDVDTSGTCSTVKDKLDSAASRYKALHSQCNQLGNNLKDVVDKYKKYDDSSAGLLKWLNISEEEARKQQSDAIAAEPQTLQKQLEETKALQGQMTGHQTSVDTLRKIAESLITSEGDLLSNPEEIQETVDDITERYDNLSKSVSDRNEKLQITLTRSMSVQDGLDEMMAWMEGVEASVKEKEQIPLDSASIGDILSKEAALEQDIASRQSSITAMKAKLKKFVETADPSAAVLLQSKMDALSQRFSDACSTHKQKVSQLEQLKEKVGQFETVADKVQEFVVKRLQDLHETDGPGKTFNELSQLMQSTKAEMAEHASDLVKLQTLSKELTEISPDGNKAQIQSKMDNISNIFTTFKDTVQEKEHEVSSCQDQLGEFRSAASVLTKWLEETNERVPAVQPSGNEKSLEKELQTVTELLDEWTSKDPDVQDLNSKGSALCSLITSLTSPAKTKTTNKSAITNGGCPVSHSYLTNKELMGIQQNMSFVNEGYASLGEVLKSRATELSSSVRDVKEAQKDTEDMMTWLKDMKTTAASWNNAATERDSVKTQLEQQKAFEGDMKQREEQLQKLREKLLNLIKTHPNSPEAAKWKQMLAEIDAGWTDISGSVEQRKQHLEQSNKNLDIFQTAELQLSQWLSEKELMMSVLGPLSIDLNMLKMQKQQVQILQNEFKSRKPQYEQLEEAASAILSTSGNQDPSNGKQVREQLVVITQKWQGLTEQLDQRDSLIDQAVVKTGQFQELLKTLSHSATQLESQLTNHQGHSTQPDAVKKQLEDVHNISAQLREERKNLKEAEAINAELTAMVTEDYLKADLARQLDSISKPFKQLEEKAAKRIEQLNSTFASSQQFHQTSKDFQSWLGEKLQDQSKPQAISAKVDVLQQSLDEHSKLQRALSEHEEIYNTIVGEGDMLLQNTDGAEKLALQGQLTTLLSNWEEVKRSSAEQGDKLQTALQKSLKYQEHAENLSSWIQECEASKGRVKLTTDPVAAESSISQVKALQKDVDKHRRMVEQLDTAAESLLEVATVDTQPIKEEKATLGKRVDSLVEDLQSKRESLEKISHTVKEFNDAYREAKGQLEGAKKHMDSYESQGVQGHSNKNLTNMKAQQKSLEGVQNQVEHMKSLAKDLVVNIPDADGVTDLLLQADSIEKDYSNLNEKLDETCQVLEGKLQGIGQFQISIREMYTQFTDLDDELDSMAPVDLDLAPLKEQQVSIQSFVSKLQELMANTANAGDSCKKMLETETSPDLLGLKRDLDALSKQCGKLLDRGKGREMQVQSTLTKLEELYDKLHQMEKKLCTAVEKEATQEAVGMETDVINHQLEAFKAFQKEHIDALQTQLQDINSLSQGLIQTAAKGTSTKKLEDDLEGVNTKWNTLNKKIAERSAQLHEALLHCGRFQDALESLLSWLTDTEELVANQKPPSAEFKVVKAQIQEQKLLQRLLDDRKPTVELIKKEGGKVAELADSVDKEKVAKEIECLGQRWDALLKKAGNRQKQLESILVVTQQFHETLEPLSEWLAVTEKHLANSEPIGTETSKLKDQISQHKALEEEIMNHSKDLLQAVSVGQMLKSVSSVDDKEFVQSKLDSTQASYIELQERCRRKAEMLQQALANAQLFGEDEVALMNWLHEVHTRLGEVSVEDYKAEVLEKQLAEQRELQSDIVLRKKNVDQAISNGMELLKQTTGDEVVVIQGKLDGIKSKYAEISSMSDGVLKTLERVSSLSSKLQHTHEDLNSWLEKVEAEISAFAAQEPVGEQLVHAQDRQNALLKETKDHKSMMDKLNELSGSLLDLIPWHTREGLDKLVTEDNGRYRAVRDTITQQVDQINADILKSQQFEQAADTELSWLSEAERKLLSMGEIRLEQDQNSAQLQAQKIFSMDIMRHKDAVDEIVKTGKAIMSSKKTEEKDILEAKTETLLEKYSVVSQLNSERCLQLERTQSLASQFWETYEEMWPWLQETMTTFSQLPTPAIEYDTLRQQQEELRQMRELIAEHKPHIDKMNKTGPQLLELSPVEGVPIREKYTASDQLYTNLKADVKQRAATLDEAISKSTQFHDKIDPMLESLERIAERLRQPPSISVEVDKIKEQISENKAVYMDLEKLQPSYETLRQRGGEMIARSEGADKDMSAKAVQDKMDQMVVLWNDIHTLLEERESKLLDVMDLADKFWCDHSALIITIKDSEDLLRELEEPGVDPSVVKQQQEFVEGFKEEIDGLQEELDVVQNQGAELMTACGEPDKPVIKKSLDEVNSAWEHLNKTWKERGEQLEEAMQAAVQFQDGLQGMFDWVDIMESKLDSMSPVGTDLETVKQQIVELKEYKGEAYQLQIEMERLNHQAGLLLKKVTEEADRCAIQEPMSELKMLWNNLDEKIISRQHKLEGGLLALGQFQHALDELLAWMSHTEELLNEQRKAGGDPKAIEIELAKHHVLQIDVLAHKTTVETVNKAGNDLVESSAGEEASSLQTKLENLNQQWKAIQEKTEQRKQQLESALLQAQGFHGEIEDMQQWLKDTERQLLASKAVGGLPDTAREQLNVHLELCSALEVKEELYQELLNKGHQLLMMTPEGPDSNLEQDLANLKEKWEAVQGKVTDRKVKLEEALTVATDFHNSLQDFINWLTQAEQTLNMVSPASLILETIMFQIDEHKIFVTEVNSHRDHIIELDKTGTHLKYFSQKQDVVLIKNLLLSVQGRWEKLVQRSVERGRLLDDSRKRAKQFHETWNKLMEWLDESEKTLDSEVEIANEPDKIKMQLTQHKEFQKSLGSKHSVYDTTSRTGRALKDKTSLQDDNQKLDDMLSELRDKWDTVCGKSIERQNKLEEALLFSGQFTVALQALIDWLYRVEPQLAEDQPVHGDIDLVLNLIDNHKVFQKEMGKRTVSVQALKRSARELIESSHNDSSWVKVQMQELSTRWETVCNLSVSKQARLEQALCQAEEFHSTVHILLEWLAEAEQSLRFHGSLPDDEEALRALIEQHKEFMKKLEEKRVALSKSLSMGEAILTICHPDSITTIKHWNTIIKARFEEVQAWARQHQQRLTTALSEMLTTQELLENLLTWLQWAESNLNDKDKEVLPQEIEEIKSLIAEHQAFMEEMTRKQPDVDKITKTHKRKTALEPQNQKTQIPVLDKGRTGRKRSPTQTMYASATQAPIETKDPRVNLLVTKWQHVWLLALDRRRKLNDALDRLEELKEFANFDFDVWRKRYMRWMNHKTSRVMDFFRRIDKDQDGKVTRQEFIEGILSSKFPTSRLEMSAVADIFDRDGDGYIDYYEFVAALHPNKEAYKPLTDADKIEDEVTRQVAKCKCPKRFQVEQIGANKYRFYLGNQFGLVHCLHDSLIGDETIANRENQNLTPHLHVAVLESCILFGDSQQLRLVRILRSTVMVRVGGGWMALDEFLVKNDPCRVHHHGSKMLRSESNSSITQSPIGWQISHFLTSLHEPTCAKGRTNLELREKFILPEGTTQVMASFRYRGRRSRPSSRGASPNRSTSSQSCPCPANPAATSTPKITPVQGSKLRLPGYLSGKGFQSSEEGTLISAAVLKARAQTLGESRKNSSRPGSKAGSRGSSRRGSDASDFDISDIQSVCSDVSETVGESSRATPRSASRQHGGKPSKIPTPQRRTTPTSKLAKGSKR
ncbi:dystonin isoform X8 [Solea solea]|uniref:dystonin isoform X8 n=1 Tax=Solea solea TaxID=90069 RepID=UPI0027298BB7|nr:dystonin isoform X8 [Solea solea]